MPAEWKLSPVHRHSQPRTVGPEPLAARLDSRGDEPAMSTCGEFETPGASAAQRTAQ